MEQTGKIRKIILVVIFLIVLLCALNKSGMNIKSVLKNDPATSKEYIDKYNLCLDKLESQLFDEASGCFKELMEKKENPHVKYLYAVSAGYAKNYSEAVSQLEELKNDPNIEDEKLKNLINDAYKEFLKYKNSSESFKRSDRGNYVGELRHIAVWKNPKSIKVCIYDDYNKKSEIKKAFKKWDSELSSVVNFIYTSDCNSADITAKAVDISRLHKGEVGVTHSQEYYHANKKSKKYLKSANIEVSYNKAGKNLWTDDEFQGIILHEIGHALGILDHSKNKGDIMYYDDSTYCKDDISNRDVNTVKRIYGSLI